MKELLAVLSLVICGAVAEPPAPYPASGWRPNGPSFELPQRGQAQFPQSQQYLPPLDPRNPTPSIEYGVPEEDVSVQGLPAQEEVQYFQNSPINGQQNVGAAFKSDIRNLDQGFKQSQFQQQQQTYQQFDRQRQIDSRINSNNLPRIQPPGPFARTTPAPTESTTPFSTTEASTTELNLNEGETLEAPKKNEKVSVEVSRQKLQEYPGELFLSSLAQLQLQPQFVPLQQFGQLQSPLYLQPAQQSQKQVAGFDGQTHFAALPSVLAQQQLQKQQFQKPALLISEQPQQPIAQYQPVAYQPQPQFQAEPVALQPQTAYGQPEPLPQYQPVNAYQPQVPAPFPPQQVVLQPQNFNQLQPVQPVQPVQPNSPENQDAENIDQYQPQLYQQPFLVPQGQFQGQFQPQPALVQAQPVSYPAQDFNQYQNQFAVQQPQSQDALQSGLDVNQGNDIDEQDREELDEQDEGTRATAVATAFGARTQPRVFSQYGAPFPVPKVQANPGLTTTESPIEDVTEDGPIVAQAVAVADGGRKKSARLRNRRIRPLFTLDRSGHLVLAPGQ